METPDLNLILKQASLDLKQGEYENLIALCQQCIEAEPTRLSHYWYLGLAYLLQGDELEAQSIWVSPFIEKNPEDYEAGMAELLIFLQEQAEQLLIFHQSELAERIYEQALEIEPENFEIYTNLGIALSEQGKYDEAISCWQKAIALEPQHPKAYQLKGELYEKLGQFEDAIACYSQALAIKIDSDILYHLGLCYLHCQQFEKSIVYFEKSIQLNPNFASAYSDLGYALLQRSQPNEAKAVFEQALQLESRFIQAYLSLRFTESETQPTHNSSYPLFDRLLEIVNSNRSIDQSIQQKTTETDIIQTVEPSQSKSQGECLETCVEMPQGFYENTLDWINLCGVESRSYIKIFENNSINFKPPRTIDPSLHFSFRFGKQIQLPDSFVVGIPNGRYWLNSRQTRSATITSDRQLLGDLSPESPILEPGHPDKHPSKHSIFELATLPPVKQIEGTVAVLSGLSNDVYFHWMLDILPRFELLNRSGMNFKEIDYFLIDDRTNFQQESLQTLNIPKSKILNISLYSHLRASKLIVPSFPGSVAWMPSWTCDFLKRLFLSSEYGSSSDWGDRIYISRGKAQSRRVLNEDEVIIFLEKFGFKSVNLESLSIREQASLLSKTSVVIAPHGSGLTNLVFCQPGTKAIEIFSPNYVYPCYWLVSNLVNIEYYYLLGKQFPGFYLQKLIYPDDRHEDIFVDLQKMRQILELAKVD